MTILTQQGSGNQFFLGYLENGFTPTSGTDICTLDVVSLINADVAAFINATTFANWTVRWQMQIYCARFYNTPQTFQSPIDSTNAFIAEFLGSSSQTSKTFGNHICQTLDVCAAWGNRGTNGYPRFEYYSLTPNPCTFMYMLPSTDLHADTISILAQNASLADMIYRVLYSVLGFGDISGYYVNLPIFGQQYI